MKKILVGTSGYSYLDWVGPVYPERTKEADFVALYAQLFEAVEINFSYYRMPTALQLQNIARRAVETLRFSVKANGVLTHKIDDKAWRGEAEKFIQALEPLRVAGRLDAVLFQFPYSFDYEPGRRRYLDSLLSYFAGFPVAVEFRNSDWYNNRVIETFRRRELALVALDMPALKGLPPLMDVVTAPLAYVRFHGRNEANWWGSEGAARYDYRYSQAELMAWADRLAIMAERAGKILVFFNNHWRGQAVENARELADILKGQGV